MKEFFVVFAQALLPLSVITIWVAMIIGWFMNLFAIFHSDFTVITGLLVLRIVGIFLAPIGGVMGLFI